MGVSLIEQETVVNFGRQDDLASVYTTDLTVMTKLRKLLKAEGTEWTVLSESDEHMEVEGPKNLVSFRVKRAKLSEERKEALAEQMKKIRDK